MKSSIKKRNYSRSIGILACAHSPASVSETLISPSDLNSYQKTNPKS